MKTVALLVAAVVTLSACGGERHEIATGLTDLSGSLDALLDAGADLEAQGAVIGGGAPLADAVAFGQWKCARRLVERGAETSLWEAAALGLADRVEAHLAGAREPEIAPAEPGTPDDVTHAFWCACHGGPRTTAELLLRRGADANWVGYDDLTPLDAARRSNAEPLVARLLHVGAKSRRELEIAGP